MQEHFLHLQLTEGGVKAQGTDRALLGHMIGRGPKQQPDGVFVSWRWDGKTLALESDRYGAFPVYYYTRPEEFCLSTSLSALLEAGASQELDYGALLTFLRLGFFLAEDTPFTDVRALPPGARLVWEDGKLEVSGGYSWGKPLEISRDDAIDSYISLFREAVRRRVTTQGTAVVPLSGGRDSRHILFELTALRHDPDFCITHRYYPPRPDDDVAVAAEVARALGLEHRIVPQQLGRFDAEVRKNITTNFCSDEHAQVLCLVDYLEGKVQALYDGLAGDVLSAGLFLNGTVLSLFQARRWSSLIDHVESGVFTRAARFLAQFGLLSNELNSQQNHEDSRERMRREFQRHADAPNPVSSFYFWNRTRREIALVPYVLLRGVPVVYAPYLDHGVYDLLSGLPPTFFLDKRFHTEAIMRAYPEYEHIPFASPGWRSDGLRRQSRELARSVRRLLARGEEGPLLRRRPTIPWVSALASLSRPSTAVWLAVLYLAQLEELASGGGKLR